MAFNNLITRSDAQALIPEDVADEIIQGAIQQSCIMRYARRLPNMSRNQRRMPVLSSLITAQFVTGDIDTKQTADSLWNNKFLDAEELAVIVPVPENVLDDVDFDIFGEIRPRIEEAFGLAFDKAVCFGTNAPSSWPLDIVSAAVAAGNSVSATTGTGVDLYDDILGDNGTLSLVEQDGFMVTGHIAPMVMRGKLRGLRDAVGQPIFQVNPGTGEPTLQGQAQYFLDGAPVDFPRNGSQDPNTAVLISGDFTQLVWSVRRDITFKVLDQAVIMDGSGNIVFNLAQQDMIALRATMRLAWQVPNPINRLQTTEASRYPFGVLTP